MNTAGGRVWPPRPSTPGFRPDPQTGAVNAPIYASSTFAQDGVGGLRGGFEYARTGNPTRAALEASLAAVEEAAFGRAFSSGMAATDCALRAVLRPGDHVVMPDDAYGGTFRLIDKVFTQWGIDYTAVALSDLDAVRAAITPQTKLIWVETPTNPLLSIADISAIAADRRAVEHKGVGGQHLRLAGPAAAAAAGRRHRAALDDQVHRRALRCRRRRAADQRRGTRRRVRLPAERRGCGAGPVRRLPDHARAQDAGAAHAAAQRQRRGWSPSSSTNHPAIETVLYPGLPSHPGHDVAARQMSAFGGMVSVRLRGGIEAARDFCSRTEVFILAESLGGVESLIEHPGAMTHASTAGSQLEVPDDLVRLSVGIEDAADLLADLEQALG